MNPPLTEAFIQGMLMGATDGQLLKEYPSLPSGLYKYGWIAYTDYIHQTGSTVQSFREQKHTFLLLVLEALEDAHPD